MNFSIQTFDKTVKTDNQDNLNGNRNDNRNHNPLPRQTGGWHVGNSPDSRALSTLEKHNVEYEVI